MTNEALLAIKASGQIGFLFRGGVEGAAQRAVEPQHGVYVAHLQVQQIGDHRIDGDPVSQLAKKIRWDQRGQLNRNIRFHH